MSFTNFLELELLDHVWGAAVYTAPVTLYVGLTTADPTDTGSYANEPTATGGYARIAVTNNVTNFPAAAAGSKSNGVAFTFPESTAAWSTGATNLTHFFISDSATLAAGNMLGKGTLTTARAVNAAGVTLQYAASALVITLD